MGKVEPATEQPQGEITIDPTKRLVIIEQRTNRFALKPDTVTVPFDFLKVLAAQVTLVDAGMIQVGPASSVVGQGEGNTADAGAARSPLRVN